MAVGKLSLVAFAFVAGCAQPPRARAITGPDGSEMMHIACGGDQGACFELAGRSCPHGYQLSPVFDARDNFLVRCRAPGLVAARPERIAPPAAASAPFNTPEWPPPEQSWATPDPWSTAASGAPGANSDLPPTQYLPNGQIDVGY